jgi:hypothetical protein
MNPPHTLRLIILAMAMAAGGCAGTAKMTAPDVPANLTPPAGQVLFLEAVASGVQVYECAAKADQPTTFEWTFRAPEAALSDRRGRSLGKHYAGPTWESNDASTVVGEVRARDPGPDATAIAWLLLNAKSTSGNGVFSKTASIQRIATVGGPAPSLPCTAGNAKQVVRVPYSAVYYFYRAAP